MEETIKNDKFACQQNSDDTSSTIRESGRNDGDPAPPKRQKFNPDSPMQTEQHFEQDNNEIVHAYSILPLGQTSILEESKCQQKNEIQACETNHKSDDAVKSADSAIISACELKSLVLTADDLKPLARTLTNDQFLGLAKGCLIYFANFRSGTWPIDHFAIDTLTDLRDGKLVFKHGLEINLNMLTTPRFLVNCQICDLWMKDMQKWNEPLPKTKELSIKVEQLRDTVTNITFTIKALNSLLLKPKHIFALLRKGPEVFEDVAVGCFTQFKQQGKTDTQQTTFVDRIVGVTWDNPQYELYHYPCTVGVQLSTSGFKLLNELLYKNLKDKKFFDQWKNKYRKLIPLPNNSFVEKKHQVLKDIMEEHY